MSATQKKHEIEDILFARSDLPASYVTRLLEEYAEAVREETVAGIVTEQILALQAGRP